MPEKYEDEEDEDEEKEKENNDETDEEEEPQTKRTANPTSYQASTNTSSGGGGIVLFIGILLLVAFAVVVAFYISTYLTVGLIIVIATIFLIKSLHTIRPNARGLIERLGKYNRFGNAGLIVLIPFIERLIIVNITETMVEVDKQEIITKDSLNATVDAQIYFRVKPDEQSVKDSQYNVFNYQYQIVQLARTTLRAIIGSMTLMDANTLRGTLNSKLADELRTQIVKESKKAKAKAGKFEGEKYENGWGIEIVRAELKELTPPPSVQESMNQVVVAEKNKIAAIDNAAAVVNKAEGDKQAVIKVAEGFRQKEILEAEGFRQAEIERAMGKAKAVELVSNAENKFFRGNAQMYKKLETAQIALQNNAKFVFPAGTDIVNVIGQAAGVIPIKKNKE